MNNRFVICKRVNWETTFQMILYFAFISGKNAMV